MKEEKCGEGDREHEGRFQVVGQFQPPRLKPHTISVRYGTAEAVPLQTDIFARFRFV